MLCRGGFCSGEDDLLGGSLVVLLVFCPLQVGWQALHFLVSGIAAGSFEGSGSSCICVSFLYFFQLKS